MGVFLVVGVLIQGLGGLVIRGGVISVYPTNNSSFKKCLINVLDWLIKRIITTF